jgi:hypothetical protein
MSPCNHSLVHRLADLFSLCTDCLGDCFPQHHLRQLRPGFDDSHLAGDQSNSCFSCAIMLWWVARATRDLAKQNLTEGIIRAKDAESNPRLAEQLETLLAQVAQLNKGTFGPLSQQPLVKALLFPLSSAGWVALIENGTIPGF